MTSKTHMQGAYVCTVTLPAYSQGIVTHETAALTPTDWAEHGLHI